MKKKGIASLLLLSFVSVHANRQEVFSRTFMYTHPWDFNLAQYNALWHEIAYTKIGKKLESGVHVITGALFSTPRKKIARYFMPECINEVVISGDSNTKYLNTRNVRAEWLGLPSNFYGIMTLSPQQRQYGMFFEYNQELRKLFDIPFLKDYWLSISMPINSVENDLRIKQFDVMHPGTTDPKDIIEAFNQPSWTFGKISPEPRTHVGITDIKIKFGKTFIAENHNQLIYYSGIVIPTAGHPSAEYLFDPFLGNGGHFGFLAGVNCQILLNRDISKWAWSFFANIDTVFLARNTQKRTFDLKCKPWSRFLQFVKKGEPSTNRYPGVNVLTRKVTSRPYNFVDFCTGWRLNVGRIEAELGYSIWGHGDEELRFVEPCHNIAPCLSGEFGIAAPIGVTVPDGTAATASKSTISTLAATDRDITVDPAVNAFVAITDNDIDVHSAESESALNQKAHFSIGFVNIGKKVDTIFGTGFYIEVPQKNSALKIWGFWFKAGATF